MQQGRGSSMNLVWGLDILKINILTDFRFDSTDFFPLSFPLLGNSYSLYNGYPKKRLSDLCARINTVCPRSLHPFYIVAYYLKWGKNSWIFFPWVNLNPDLQPGLRFQVKLTRIRPSRKKTRQERYPTLERPHMVQEKKI